MTVKVKFTSEEAKKLYLAASKGMSIFPFKTHNEDFCYDVVATSRTEIAPNVYKYGVGLAFQVYRLEGFSSTRVSIDLRPRSSVWKTGMVLSNCAGTVDETYTGEVSAVFYHLFPDMPIYEVGDRIGQIKIGTALPMNFVEVDELDDTARGAGGYGSTGK